MRVCQVGPRTPKMQIRPPNLFKCVTEVQNPFEPGLTAYVANHVGPTWTQQLTRAAPARLLRPCSVVRGGDDVADSASPWPPRHGTPRLRPHTRGGCAAPSSTTPRHAQGAGPRRAARWCPDELRRRAAGGVCAAPPPRLPQDPAATRGSAAASPWPRPTAGGARGGPPWGRAELGEARVGGDGRRGGGWPARGGAEAAAPRPLPRRGREGGGARARPCLRPPLLARRRGGRCDEAGGTDGTRRDPALLPPRRRPWRRLAMALRDGGAREARQ